MVKNKGYEYMKKGNSILDNLIRRCTRKQTKKEYGASVLKKLEEVFSASGSSTISFKTDEGNVEFERDPATGRVSMFVNNEEIPKEDIAEKIAEIDGYDDKDSSHDAAKEAIKDDFRRYAGRKALDSVIDSAKKQSREASETSESILRGIMRILMASEKVR